MNYYHEKLLSSYAVENIIGLFTRYKGAAKEITESFGLLEAGKRYCTDIHSSLVYVVGDGRSPRTGALFAYYTGAEVVSIDPIMNMDHWNEHVEKQTRIGFKPKRITVLPVKVEDNEVNCNGKDLVMVWPHSHADMNSAKVENYKSRTDIALPCCVKIPSNFLSQPHISYDDLNITSPKRTVHIWFNQ